MSGENEPRYVRSRPCPRCGNAPAERTHVCMASNIQPMVDPYEATEPVSGGSVDRPTSDEDCEVCVRDTEIDRLRAELVAVRAEARQHRDERDFYEGALIRANHELTAVRAEADTLRTKLEMPCGSCHPCAHLSSPDRVELRAQNASLRAALGEATALLRTLAETIGEVDSGLLDIKVAAETASMHDPAWVLPNVIAMKLENERARTWRALSAAREWLTRHPETNADA